MSTSQKHKDFVSEPMGEKSNNEIAGIGAVLGKRLTDEGFDKVYVLYNTIYYNILYYIVTIGY